MNLHKLEKCCTNKTLCYRFVDQKTRPLNYTQKRSTDKLKLLYLLIQLIVQQTFQKVFSKTLSAKKKK